MSKHLFNGQKCGVEAKVKVIYHSKHGDIIYQYIMFCKILDEQIKKHGYSKMAIQETIRICSSKKILQEYLRRKESEIMNIMSALFDQDVVTSELIAAKEARTEERGKKNGERNSNINSIKNMMCDLGVTLSKALDVLKIPETERAYYIKMIEEKKVTE